MTAPSTYDIAVIGAGVVGAAIARELSRLDVSVLWIEAGADVGAGTSKANTAILHTGFDAPIGSTEARLVAAGYHRLLAHCHDAGIAVEVTGALLIAWTLEQLDAFPGIVAKAEANGYHDIRRVDVAELYRREPSLGPGALGALEVPGEGIVDPWSVPLSFAYEAVANGVDLRLESPVVGLRLPTADTPGEIRCASETVRCRFDADVNRCRFVVNAAGLHADEIDRLAGYYRFTVRPRRGELIVFDKLARPLVHHILLPVPTATTKGVLVAPTVFGNVLLGPTAEDLDDKTATGTSARGLASLLESGRRIVPDLVDEEITATYAGLRAATEHPDYQIHRDGRYVCVGGIRSTGLTAAMAIASEVRDLLVDAGLDPTLRPNPAPPPAMINLGEAFDRSYQSGGTVVCFCERVTAADITAACSAPIPARDFDGLRRRTRALSGRCQGFFCGAELAARLNDPVEGR